MVTRPWRTSSRRRSNVRRRPRHGRGGEVYDEGKVLEDDVVEGRGRPRPEDPAGCEEGPGGHQPGQVRGRPAPHRDVQGASEVRSVRFEASWGFAVSRNVGMKYGRAPKPASL